MSKNKIVPVYLPFKMISSYSHINSIQYRCTHLSPWLLFYVCVVSSVPSESVPYDLKPIKFDGCRFSKTYNTPGKSLKRGRCSMTTIQMINEVFNLLLVNHTFVRRCFFYNCSFFPVFIHFTCSLMSYKLNKSNVFWHVDPVNYNK